MNLAPLQLIRYWIDDMVIHANRKFDIENEGDHFMKSLNVESKIADLDPPEDAPEACGLFWLVSLAIKVGEAEDDQDPYEIELNLSGVLQTSPEINEDSVRRIVEVNGPSMLFGTAREVIRGATANGPFAAVLLPSISFLPDKEKGEA